MNERPQEKYKHVMGQVYIDRRYSPFHSFKLHFDEPTPVEKILDRATREANLLRYRFPNLIVKVTSLSGVWIDSV